MSEVSRRCPYCKEVPYRTGGDDPLAVHGCKAGDQEGAVVERLSRWQSRPIEDELQAEIESLREIAKASNMLIQFGIRHSAECSIYDGNDICDCGRDEYVSDHAKAWDRWQRNALKAGRDE